MQVPTTRPPSLETLLAKAEAEGLVERFGRTRTKAALRSAAERLRRGELSNPSSLLPEALLELEALRPPGPQRVVNATGVLLHTNLGRAPLAEVARTAVLAASGYCTLEFQAEAGQRGRRTEEVTQLILELYAPSRDEFGAALTTNTAGALLLALDTLANGRPVAVSRGELVAIGGDFRIPSILARSGASLREVGTTNKTTVEDYAEAVSEGAAVLLKVHPSNYRVVGYTEEASLAQLSELGRRTSIPLLFDAGSGAPRRFEEPGLAGEPVPIEALDQGADVVCFSGDKTLGGPQAGILIGRKEPIERMAANPLARALRPDKLALAALAATLDLHLSGRSGLIPFYRMLRTSLAELERRATALANRATLAGYEAEPVVTRAMVGGGSGADSTLPSWGVALRHRTQSPDELARTFRTGEIPVIGRVFEDRLLLDLRTIDPGEDDLVALVLAEAAISRSD